MNEQLDVFLGAETKPFLLRLFEVISSEDYLNTPAPAIHSDAPTIDEIPTSQDAQSSSTINESESTVVSNVDSQHSIGQSTSEMHSRHTRSNDPTTDNESDYVNLSPLGSSISKLRDVSPISPNKAGNDNSEHHRQQQRRASARSRSRSPRSRSPRSRLSHPRRNNEREKYSGGRSHYRNKSPNDSDRRKPNNSNPFRRNSGHERSPKYYKRSDSPIDSANGERLATRSLSPVLKNNRCRDFDEKG